MIFNYLGSSSSSELLLSAFKIFLFTSFLWLPIVLITLFLKLWLIYIRALFIKKQGSVLLEIKLPKEITKSAAAMELFFVQLYQTAGVNFVENYWVGKVRPWYSLELVSLGGEVHFFIWTHLKFRNIIESQIYAQYPNVEIYEAKDYVKEVTSDSYQVWGTNFKLTDSDAYPIKTYVDYGLDKNPEEEEKIDPLTTTIEYLGSLKKGEQAWIQIIIQANKKEWIKEGSLTKIESWKKSVEKEIEKVKKGMFIESGKDGTPSSFQNIGPQSEKLEALQRSISKFAFDTVFRGLYIAREEAFNPANISGLIGSTRQYNSNNLNGFKPGFLTDTDYFWQDFKGIRLAKMKRYILDAYKHRGAFHPPYKNVNGKPFVLTTEELATIFHFPGGVSTTPTFSRIQSRKAEPPANLPV